MGKLERIATITGLAIPLVALAWYAGTAYDKLEAALAHIETLEAQIQELRIAQAEDRLVNERVDRLAEQIDDLRFHHHDVHGGRAHSE